MLTSFKTLEFGQRMYVASTKHSSLIFDPGVLTNDVLKDLSGQIKPPVAIFLTHGHFDHLNGIPQIRKMFGEIPVFMNSLDEPILKQNRLLQFITKSKTEPFLLQEYINIENPIGLEFLDQFKIMMISTPGHTPGSTCFIHDRNLISGDTLLRGESGPTMLPGGNPESMRKTILQLKERSDFDRIAPGHGDYFSKFQLDWNADGI